MRSETCELCRYWAPRNEHVGDCRRHTPSIGPNDEYKQDGSFGPHTAVWPITFADEWCGEFAVSEAYFTDLSAD